MDLLDLELHLYTLLVPCDLNDSPENVQIKVWRTWAQESARLGFLEQTVFYNDKADSLENFHSLSERVIVL